LQSISILVYLLEYRACTGPHLIVVPKSTLSNWMNEFGRWAPTIKVVKFHGDRATREEIAKNVLEPAQRDEDRDWHVCITTYEICNIERSVLQKFCWTYFILDEAHRLKNESSALSKTVRSFETSNRILITGTPLQNSLHELWALLNFLVPDVFESSEQVRGFNRVEHGPLGFDLAKSIAYLLAFSLSLTSGSTWTLKMETRSRSSSCSCTKYYGPSCCGGSRRTWRSPSRPSTRQSCSRD
jgi:SNF2-related domain